MLVITFYTLPVIIFFQIKRSEKFIILFSAILILLLNLYYGYNKIDKVENIQKKIISPSIKLVSPKFNIERFFINEPIEDKIKELFEISYPFDKDLLLIFPEGMTNIGEINQLDGNFNKISNQLTPKSKIILGIT